MSIDEKLLSTISEEDVAALVANKVCETSRVEFKRELMLQTDDQKREFLADTTAFANGSGGRILLGIDAPKGLAADAPGIDPMEADALILQATNLLRDSVKPPILGIDTRLVPCKSGQAILIINIPQSFIPPHMVSFRGSQKFFIRSSNGKHLMEYSEIRSSFLKGATTRDKLDSLRSNRIQRVLSGSDFRGIDTSVPAFLLEVVPVVSLYETRAIAFYDYRILRPELKPIDSYSGDSTFDFEGLVNYEWDHRSNKVGDYCRLNRAGYISAYSTSLCYQLNGKPALTSSHFESKLSESTKEYSSLLSKLGCSLPHAVLMTLINAKGMELRRGPLASTINTYHPILESYLLAQDSLITDETEQPIRILRPQFDAFWNAFGIASCLNYNKDGNWAPPG